MSVHMIDTAKDLIKKGNELGDEELVNMGHQMLAQYQTETTPVEEPKKEGFDYVCSNCSHEFTSPKKRKACPECRKHKLQAVVPQEETKNTNRVTADDFTTTVINKENRSRKRINPDTGEEEGSYARNEPIVPGTIKNIWEDDGSEFKDDEFDQKVRYKVSPRTRKPPKKQTKVCEECQRKFVVSVAHVRQYKCDTCIARGGRRR